MATNILVWISFTSPLHVFKKPEPATKSLSFGPFGARMYSEYALSIVERQHVAENRFVRNMAKGGKVGCQQDNCFRQVLGVDERRLSTISHHFLHVGAPFFQFEFWNIGHSHTNDSSSVTNWSTRVGGLGRPKAHHVIRLVGNDTNFGL
jgi:hypothetical protein